MSKEENHIDEYFREALTALEIIVPQDIWEQIEVRLDKNKKRRTGYIMIWSGLAAGLALLIGFSVYRITEYPDLKSKQSAQLMISSKNNHVPEFKPIDNRTLTKNNTQIVQFKSRKEQLSKISGSETLIAAHEEPNHVKNQDVNQEILLNTAENKDQSDQKFSNKNTNQENSLSSNPPQNKNPNLISLNQGIDALPANIKSSAIINNNKSNEEQANVKLSSLFLDTFKTPEIPKIKHWSIAGLVSPQYSYRTTNQSAPSNQNDEKGLISYAGGIKVAYKTSQKFSIQTGILYSVMGQTQDNVQISEYQNSSQSVAFNSKPNTNSYLFSSINSMGPIVNNNLNTTVLNDQVYINNNKNPTGINAFNASPEPITQIGSIIQELSFIEIPVLIRYKLIDKKIGLNLIGGISSNILVNNNAILEIGSTRESIGKTENLNVMNYSSTLGVGLNYYLFKNIDLSIEPSYKYYLNSISKSNLYVYHPYGFSIYTGITYRF